MFNINPTNFSDKPYIKFNFIFRNLKKAIFLFVYVITLEFLSCRSIFEALLTDSSISSHTEVRRAVPSEVVGAAGDLAKT